MNEYKKLCQEIDRVEKEIANAEKRQEETEGRITQGQESIGRLANSLKQALLSSDEKAIRGMETEAQKAKVGLERDQMLLDGLKSGIREMKDQLTQLKTKEGVLFAEMAGSWLEKEIQEHDRLAEALRTSIRRILTCHWMLREVGHPEIYSEGLGKAFEYIPRERSILIRKFEPTLYKDYRANIVMGEDLKTVRAEIVGK